MLYGIIFLAIGLCVLIFCCCNECCSEYCNECGRDDPVTVETKTESPIHH
jgi:hypothetical protein